LIFDIHSSLVLVIHYSEVLAIRLSACKYTIISAHYKEKMRKKNCAPALKNFKINFRFNFEGEARPQWTIHFFRPPLAPPDSGGESTAGVSLP
jgi:hypothetical protein